MLAPDVRIVDIDGAHWANLLALTRRPDGGGGWLLVFVDGERVLRALQQGVGPVDPAAIAWRGPRTALAPIRAAFGASRVVVIDRGALPGLFHAAEAAVGPADDVVAQILAILRAGRRAMGKGLYVEPRALAAFPVPSYAAVQGSFDRLWPDGRSAVLYVLDEEHDRVHTSLILGKEHGDVTLVTTHLAIAGVRIGRTWPAAYRQVLEAVAGKVAPVHLGIFLDVRTWRRVAAGPPGAFAREVALRRVVFDPAPAWVMGLVGGAAAVGAIEGAAALLGRFLPQPPALAARVFGPLGFDPLQLWRAWRARGR